MPPSESLPANTGFGLPGWDAPDLLSTPFQDTLHWVYVAAMAAAALLFFAWSVKPRGVPRYEYTAAIFIVVWSGIMYAAMAMGYGKVAVDGQVTHYARYLDWLVSTPLLLFTLVATGMFASKKDPTLFAAVMGADAVMIACGLLADISTGLARISFYIAGCAAFLVVLWLIWGPVRTIAVDTGERLGRFYTNMALFLSVLWIGYPLFWLLGPSGMALWGQTTDTFLFVALPIVSKAIWSAVDLYGLRTMIDHGVHAYGGHPHEHLGESHHYPAAEAAAS